MRQYYYFLTSLKEISLESRKPPVSPKEFHILVEENIASADELIIRDVRYYFDNKNIINILNKVDEFNEFGAFTKAQLEEAIIEPDRLRSYLKSFLEGIKYEERVYPEYSLENELLILYHKYLVQNENRFLSNYVEFSFAMTNVSVALNCRKYDQLLEGNVLKLSDLSDGLITSKASDFGLSHDYDWLSKLMTILEDKDFVKTELALVDFRFEYLDRVLEYDYFGFNNILAYYIKLFVVDRICKFDEVKGKEIFNKITDDLCNCPIDLEE